jgi:HEAT repeat protein
LRASGAAKSLFRALETGDGYAIKYSAVDALSQMPHLDVQLLLAKLLDHRSVVSDVARDVLAKASNIPIEPLVQALTQNAGDARLRVAIALEQRHDPRSVIPIAHLLKNDSSDLRKCAASILGQLRDPQAIDFLAQALRDFDISVRLSVTEALGRMTDSRVVEPLIVALKDDSNVVVRQKAAESLGRMGDPRAVAPLIRALGANVLYVRAAIARALGALGDSRAVEPLVEALTDTIDAKVRKNAAEALGRIGDARAAAPLIQALTDEEREVRLTVAEALKRIAHRSAIPSLLNTLRDPDYMVAAAAKSALDTICSSACPSGSTQSKGMHQLLPGASEQDFLHIIDLTWGLRHSNKGVRHGAATALIKMAVENPALQEYVRLLDPIISQKHSDGEFISGSSDCRESQHGDTGIGLSIPF